MPFDYQDIQRQVLQKQQELENLQNLLQNGPIQANSMNPFPQSNFFLDPAGHQPQHHHAMGTNMPRSKSNTGYSPASTRIMERSSDLESPQPVKRARVMSQQHPRPAPMAGMSRSTSNRLETSMPFVAKGPVVPLQTSNTASAAPNTMMDRFCQSNDGPVLFQQPLQRTPSNRRQSSLAKVEEHAPYGHGALNVGMSPGDYLATQDDCLISPPMPPQQSYLAPDGRSSHASLVASVCPSMSSGTSAPETMPLTRENSSFDNRYESQSLNGALEMHRINSTQSQLDFMTQDLYAIAPGTSPNTKPESFLAHVGAGADMYRYPQQSPLDEHILSQSSLMERSISANSTASTKSTQERRLKEVFQQQINNASRTALAPKPADANKSAQSTAKKEGKVAVSKGTYTRPKHPKVYCSQCSDHPDGFRGDHELRRHINAKHEGTIKKFICRDPAIDGLKSTVEALNPLSKCKQCLAGKHYGAYYNAAAHLRRTHFKPKTPRGKNKRGDEDEKRGGKGGGDWPPMQELKLWMREVFVTADDDDAAAAAEAEVQEDEDEDAVQFDPSLSLDLSLGPMSENLPCDMRFTAPYPMSELAAIDTQASSYLAVSNMPLSSASDVFTFSPFASNSPMNGLSHETAFSISSSNTVTPTTFLDPMTEGLDSYPVYC